MRSDDERRPNIIYASEHALEFPSVSYVTVAVDEPSLPLAIFSTQLSALQAIVKYLHERRSLSFARIAALLGRSQKTIWTTYAAVKNASFSPREEGLTIPIISFSDRRLAPLETLVTYLAELGLSNVESARLLKLDPRTTWTAKARASRKLEVRP